jgi:long-chain acyl-CoA synthetase
LRFLVSGGAALNPATARAFFSLGLPLLQGWGMTEASPVIAIQRFSRRRFRYTNYYERRVGSVGQALPGVEVRLADLPEKAIEVARNGEGEVLVRGENVFAGYWQADEATAAALADGWLHTGDLGRIDGDGNIYLTGRSKYVIVLDSGEKVHPDEVEGKLAESPLLADVLVSGRRARDKVQVVARVYPDLEATRRRCESEGLDLSAASVRRLVEMEIDALGRELAPYKRVIEVELSDQPLPKTALRKVAREQVPEVASFSLEQWLASSDAAP